MPFRRDGTPIDLFLRERRALLFGDTKYIDSSDGHPELYDLVRDPQETLNLLRVGPDRVAEGRRLADTFVERIPAAIPSPRGSDLSEREREQLRALGYAQ